MKPITRFLTLFFVITLSINQTFAFQQKAENDKDSSDVVRIGVNLVQVDVVVTDKKGNQVTDLQPEDFEIYQEGKKQPITNFAYISTSTKPTVDDTAIPLARLQPFPTLKPNEVNRTLAIIVDDLSMPPDRFADIRSGLKKFVDEQMQETDFVAVFKLSQSSIIVNQQFTNDKRRLYSAIEGLGFISLTSLIANLPYSSSEDPLEAFQAQAYQDGKLGTFNYIIKQMDALPGRKAVIFVSPGLQKLSNENTKKVTSFNKLIDQANRSSVAIYTINAGGLPLYIGPTAASNPGSFSFSSASSLTPIQSSIQRIQEATNQQLSSVSIVAITQQQNDGLRELAEKTGGSFVRSTNLAKLLEKTAEDQKGYYLLGYSPDEETFSKEFKDAKFHKLIVKVKKPGLKVRSRSGFYGFADQAVDEEIEISVTEQLTQALTSPFNSSDIGVKLSATVLDTDKEQRYLQALIHIDPTNIKFDKKSDQFYEASIDVATVLFGNNGLLVDKEFNNLTIQLDEEGLQNAYRNGIVQTTTLPVKNDGSYFLKVVVRDTSTSKLGTTGQTVEAFNSSDRFFVSAIAVAGSDYNQNNPLSGPAVRKFKKDAVVDFGYYVYNPQLDKLSQKPNLQAEAVIYKDGKEVFRSQKSSVRIDEIVSLKQYLVGGQLSFSNSFAKGNYILQIIIEDSNVKKSKQQNNIVSQQTDFEIID